MASSRLAAMVASLLAVYACGTQAAMLPAGQFTTTLQYDDNLNHAGEARERRAAPILSMGWQHRDELWRSELAGTQLAGQLAASAVEDVAALSYLEARIAPEFWWLSGRGFYAPSLRLRSALAWREYDSRQRDAYRYDLGLSLSMRMTTSLVLQTELTMQRSWAQIREFSGRAVSAGIGVQWRLPTQFRLFAEYEWTRRDVASSVSAQDSALSNSALPWAQDDAWSENWVYRLDSDGSQLQLGIAHRLSARLAVALRFQHSELSARDQGVAVYASAYRRRLTALTLSWSY